MKFESTKAVGILTGVAASAALAACGGSPENAVPTDPPTAASAPNTTWDSMPAPGHEQEISCVGDGTTEGTVVLANPGDHNFVFTAPDETSQYIAIGRLSATLTIHNPPVNGQDTHLSWEWVFPPGEKAAIAGDKREAQRQINGATYIMNISPSVSAPGKPQLAVACLGPKN